MSRTRPVLWLVLFALACGDDSDPRPDAHVDADTPMDGGGGTDGGVADRTAPTVVSTSPEDGATDVAADTTVVVRFSEPMADAGEIDLVGVVRSDELTWNATNDELTFVPPALPEGPVEVRLNGFADVAGNALFPHAFSFDVARSAPLVTASSPAEGATDVSGRVGTITIEFSRGMDVSVGTVSAVEGGATVLGMRWTSTRALEVSVDVLAYETTHRFALEGFTDRAGNALDATSYLEDGHLDFTTSADTDAPRVAEATPNEGTLDVDDGATTEIVLVFDEPMAEAGTATLVVDGTETVLDATWSDPRTLTLDVVGLLRGDAEHRVRLEGLTDVAGNALDGAPVLVDGALDFVTGRDVAEPFVRISDPVEGSDNVGWRRDVIRLELSEAMDTSITDVTIDDGVAPFVVTGTWSMGDSVLTLDVTGRLAAATSYRVDLRGLMDAGGTPLDADHPYLGDGALDFVGDQPTGENCRDAVTTAEATTTDGVHRWAFPEASIAFADGGASTCGVNGSPPADGVIRYTKTTGDLASGGTALRIRAEGVGNLLQERLTVQVFAGVCEPTVALATPGTELKCVSGRQVQEQYLDLPAGDYYVWFSSGGSTTAFFYGGTIELEEVAAVPEGESCVDPLDRTSAQYVAPSAAGEAESWLLTTGSMTGYDVGVVAGTDEIACDARTGPDAVIEVQKASATSVLRIHAEGDAENTTSMDFSLDLRTTCDGGEEDSVLCEYSIAPRADGARYFRGPAGTYYLWVAAEFYSIDFPTVRVSVQEIEPAAGESCATALPLTVGTTNAVSPGSTRTVDHPSCAEATDALTWYRFTATTRHTRLRSNTGALVATAHVAGARELDCREGAESRDATVFSEIGDEICVAVATDAGVTSLELEAMAYEGVAGAPTVLPFTLPINPSNGETLNPGTLYWVGLTPTTLYSNNAQVGVLTGPVAGGVMEYLQDGLGFEELGYAAVVVGEQLFVLEEQQRSGATGRVRRVIDTMGRLNPVEWDTGSAYIADGLDTDAMAYDGSTLIVVARPSSTLSPTVFYRLSATAPEAAVPLGAAAVRYVNAVAADATYLYVLGQGTTTGETNGLYRIARADLGGATPAPATQLWAAADVDVSLNGSSGSYDGMVLQRVGGRDYVYVRDDSTGGVTVTDVTAVPPRFLGVIGGRVTSSNNAIGLSADGTFLVVSNSSDDTWIRLD